MSLLAVLLGLVGRVVFSFADPAITESSGLVDLGSRMATINDSGGDPLVFVVDPTSGRTVGHVTFADHTVDVEALAPARGGAGSAVWVGDIGDNAEQRPSVQAYRVSLGPGDRRVDAPSYDLVYPDGPHDAESLVASRDDRLYVITKGVLGGTVYVAPRHLDPGRANRLRAVATVDVWATDAALFPDDRHMLVRGYDTAAIYTFPGFQPVATLDLPRQRQGEGVSIGRSGRVRLSSEGPHSAVLEVSLPDAVRAVVEPAGRTEAPTPLQVPVDVTVPDHPGPGSGTVPIVGGTLAVIAVSAVATGIVRKRRHR